MKDLFIDESEELTPISEFIIACTIIPFMFITSMKYIFAYKEWFKTFRKEST